MDHGIKLGTESLASYLANGLAREIVTDPAGNLVIGVAERPALGRADVRPD
jgi:hypothetical protein